MSFPQVAPRGSLRQVYDHRRAQRSQHDAGFQPRADSCEKARQDLRHDVARAIRSLALHSVELSPEIRWMSPPRFERFGNTQWLPNPGTKSADTFCMIIF